MTIKRLSPEDLLALDRFSVDEGNPHILVDKAICATCKARPCLVVSPDESNRHLRTVIIAPLTTVARPYPTRVALTFQGKQGQVALDQLRAIDRQRLVRKLGRISPKTAAIVSTVLVEMFTRQKT